MTKKCKKCKKEMPIAVIFNTTPLSLAQYFTWQESDKSLCPECFEDSIELPKDKIKEIGGIA